MEADLYKPPREGAGEREIAGPRKLYSPNQIAGVTFLGTILAGAWLLAQNYGALGKPASRKQAITWGIAGTIALVALSFALPDSFPNSVLPISYTFALWQAAKSLQGSAFQAHLAAGGQVQSSLRAFGIGLAGLLLVISAFAGVVFLLPE